MSSLLDYASYAVLGIFLAASAIAIFFRSGGSKAQEEAPAAAAPETKMAAKPAIVKKDFTAAGELRVGALIAHWETTAEG